MLFFVTPTERFSYSDAVLTKQFDIQPEVECTNTIDIPLPLKTRKNGTLFFHAFLAKQVYKSDWASALQDPTTSYAAVPISVYQLPVQEAFNLIRDSESSVSWSSIYTIFNPSKIFNFIAWKGKEGKTCDPCLFKDSCQHS